MRARVEKVDGLGWTKSSMKGWTSNLRGSYMIQVNKTPVTTKYGTMEALYTVRDIDNYEDRVAIRFPLLLKKGPYPQIIWLFLVYTLSSSKN